MAEIWGILIKGITKWKTSFLSEALNCESQNNLIENLPQSSNQTYYRGKVGQ